MTHQRFAHRASLVVVLVMAGLPGLSGCGADAYAPPIDVEIRIPAGEGALQIGRRLHEAGLVRYPRLWTLYVRSKGQESELKSGHYILSSDAGWDGLLAAISAGAVVTHPITIPEGFTLREAAPRLARMADMDPDSVRAILEDTSVARQLGVPGPTLEGYLLPDTYRFAEGIKLSEVLETMVAAYHAFWTAERRSLADSLGLSEREVVTLASIVEEEARVGSERPVIAGVYLNRLQIGMKLQADPTVQYALGEPRERLLFRDIDAVADNPYNTYTHEGLPPGPIAAPGVASLQATLEPADHQFLFFVAEEDGSHVFTRTNREHVNATNRIRGQRGN